MKMNLAQDRSERLQFYATIPHRCSYLPERESINAFADPKASMSVDLYARLLNHGFRRSGRHVYRPHCDACSACIATRIPVGHFSPDRSQRRNLKRNADLNVQVLGAGFRDEEFALYRRYVNTRHAGGEMDNPKPEDYSNFLIAPWAETLFVGFREGERLVCVAVVDRLPRSLSAVYSFFDPDESVKGLGSHAILWQIAHARSLGLDHVYLGYWIENHPKMGYKTRFSPIEGYLGNRWSRL